MTDGQTYYDGLIAQGYPADQALGYTQQYYPGFVSQAAAPTPMPIPAPMPVQTIAQPQAIPQPMMDVPPVGMAPMGMAPMAMMPVGEKKPIMAWAAVGCLAVALLLAISVQFTNSWLVDPDENAGISWGLNSVSIDCQEIEIKSERATKQLNRLTPILTTKKFHVFTHEVTSLGHPSSQPSSTSLHRPRF